MNCLLVENGICHFVNTTVKGSISAGAFDYECRFELYPYFTLLSGQMFNTNGFVMTTMRFSKSALLVSILHLTRITLLLQYIISAQIMFVYRPMLNYTRGCFRYAIAFYTSTLPCLAALATAVLTRRCIVIA